MWCRLLLCSVIWTVVCGEIMELFEGDNCDGGDGKLSFCLSAEECTKSVMAAKKGKPFKVCGYERDIQIVCCPVSDDNSLVSKIFGECPAANRTGLKIGQKASDKCFEYQQKLCPCYKNFDPLNPNAEEPVISYGEDSKKGDFRNMALLGYGSNNSSIEWSCGGSVISERYVLTAGHCISGREIGEVKYIALGILSRTDLKKDAKIFNVKRIVTHPEYKSPHKYNDIALLETDRDISISNEIQPACLDVDETDADGQEATATGWGALGYGADSADILQHTKLYRFTNKECSDKYRATRLMRDGIKHDTQVCYGHREKPTDTCQGDSGGPLLLRHKFLCLHSIIGVTSFGSACGRTGEPGVYTKITSYLPWIESVVWP